jgi:hypothetical protein
VKAARFPRRLAKRLAEDERRALDELRFSTPGPARRAELKTVLGWRRTREETIAFAQGLLAEGRSIRFAARKLDVEPRHLSAVLKEVGTSENATRKPSNHAGKSATKWQTPTRSSSREPLPAPAAGFRSFADLDAWLEGAAS